MLSLLYQLPYYIIIFLTVCIYPLTRNSRDGPPKVSFRIFSTVIFTHVNNYIKYYKIELRRNTKLIIAVMHAKYAVLKLKPEKRDLKRRHTVNQKDPF